MTIAIISNSDTNDAQEAITCSLWMNLSLNMNNMITLIKTDIKIQPKNINLFFISFLV